MVSDADLLVEFLHARSQDAFARIVERHGPMVMRVCLRQLRNRQDAEDASQTTFFYLAQRREESIANLGSWLYRVARDTSTSLYRSRGRRSRREREGARPMVATRDPDFGELREEFDAALMRLPAVLREAVILHYLEGRSVEEASQIAGCPEGAFRKRSQRGLHQLRDCLARRGVACGMATLLAFLGSESLAAAAPAPQAMLAMTQAYYVAHGVRHAAQPALWGKLKAVAALAAVGGGLTVGAIRHEAAREAARNLRTPASSPATTSPAGTSPTGPIRHYTFDESGGATAADSVGEAPGVLVNGPARVAGRVGPGALAFNGVDQYVVVPDAPDLRFARDRSFTLSAWVRLIPASLKGRWANFAMKSRRDGGWYGIGLSMQGQWFFSGGIRPPHPWAGSHDLAGVDRATVGWHLVTAVQDGAAGTRTLYIDGRVEASGPAWDADGPGPLYLGTIAPGDGSFEGDIDDVRIYDRALGAAEVAALRDAANAGQ